MKKLMLFLMVVLLVGTISAVSIDDIKTYDEGNKTYKLENFFGLGKHIADLELKTPQNNIVDVGYGVVAEIEIRNGEFDYDEVINGIELYNIKYGMREIFRDVDYKYKTTIKVPKYQTVCDKGFAPNGTMIDVNCREEQNGFKNEVQWIDFTENSLIKGKTITLGIFTEVKKRDYVEWVINVYGDERLVEWASFTAANIVFTDNSVSSAATDIYTFSSQNFGTADSTRIIIVGASGRGGTSPEIINVTVAGINTTQVVKTELSSNSIGMYQLALPTGTTGDVVVTWDEALVRAGIGVWALYDSNGTVRDTDSDINADPIQLTLDIPEGGAVVGYAIDDDGNDAVVNWSGITSDFNATIGAATEHGGASDNFSSQKTGFIINATSVNGASNIGIAASWHPAASPFPTVNLNSPVEAFNSTSLTINFNGTVTSGEVLANVTLFIDGVLNETNSSGINDTDYLFTKTIAEGSHNWTYEACNVNGCETATTRIFTIDTTPVINVVSPTNNSNSSISTIFFNATSSVSVDKWIVNYNGTNTTLSDINTSLEVEDGSHQLLLYANNSVSGVFGLNDSIFFNVDATGPFLNLTTPADIIDFGILTVNETLNWNVSDINLDACFYNYNFTNTTVTCSDNTTTFTLTSQRNLTFFANDTFGNLVSNFTTWSYNIFENSQTFNNETLEGVTNTFTANITIDPSNSITVANFIYNETSNIGSFSQSGNDSILTIDILAPDIITETNLTFFWSLILSRGQIINLTSNNQTVILINLDDCSVNTVVLYNYTIVDEKNQSQLTNTTSELNINLLNAERESFVTNFSKEYSINPFAVCLNENISSSSFSLDSIVKYEAIGYSIEYYNIVDTSITNSTIPQNITLYDLFSADATEFKITFKDQDFSFIENALIFIDRQYIAENNSFKTVELPKTDSNGQTIGHFVRNDVIYNIRVIKDGEVLGDFQNQIAFCEDITIGNCQMVLEAPPSDSVTFNYNEQLGIIYESTPTYDANTSSISFDFSSDDGSAKTVSMEVTRDDIFGNRSICNNTLVSAGGTLSCSFSSSIDDSTLRVGVFVNGQQAVLSSVTLESSDYGNLGYVFWFILTFLFIMIFGNSKTEVLIGLGVSLIGAVALGVTRGDIVGVGSAGIWMLVIVILGIWKINKENPQ